MPTSSHNASGRLWISSNTYRSVNGTASTHRLLSGHAQFSCPFNCSIRLGYLHFHRISHRGQLRSCSWDPTHLLSSVNAQKHSAAVSIDSLSLPGGALALQQSLIQPSPRVECLGISTQLLTCCLQSDLTKQQNGFKITLKTLEDNLLSRLSSASGNFLGETALVENLEVTKQTAAEVEDKVHPLWSARGQVFPWFPLPLLHYLNLASVSVFPSSF